MARINNLQNFITDIATAIKNKTGKTSTIYPKNFDVEINNIKQDKWTLVYEQDLTGVAGMNINLSSIGATSSKIVKIEITGLNISDSISTTTYINLGLGSGEGTILYNSSYGTGDTFNSGDWSGGYSFGCVGQGRSKPTSLTAYLYKLGSYTYFSGKAKVHFHGVSSSFPTTISNTYNYSKGVIKIYTKNA